MQTSSDEKLLNIDITDYWLILNKRFFQILIVFLLIFLGSIYYTSRQRAEYQAQSRIRISARTPMATIEGPQITWYGAGPSNSINSEIELITSKDSLLNVVIDFLKNGKESKYLNDPSDKEYYSTEDVEYIGSLSFSGPAKEFVDGLTASGMRGMIRLDPVKTSDIVEINVVGEYQDVIIAIANLIPIAYKADFWKNKTLDARDTKNFIEGQLDKAKKDLDMDRDSLEASSSQAVNLGSAERYQEELTNLRIELQKMTETYQETHPKIIKLRKLIESIENELARFPSTKQTYDDRLAEWTLRQELRKNLGEYYIKAQIDYEAKRLKSKDEVQIVSIAKPPAAKLRPNETMNIVAGALFGVIIGCIYAFIWEGLDTSIGKIEDVERITGLPVIAHIPLIGGKARKGTQFFKPLKAMFRLVARFIPFAGGEPPLDLDKKILFNYDMLSMTAEAYRTLRTNIQFAIGATKLTGNVIAITSTSPREGKTLTSTNLAISLAQMGKMTLLVEADMRRPQVADLFKISEKPGLSDLLIGTAKPTDAIRTFTDILIGNSKWENLLETPGVDNLNIIPCGTLPPNPTELLLSNEFRELVETLRQQYDYIIIDTPPTIPVSDSSIISTVADGTVMIYQSDKTSRHLLLRAIQNFKKNQSKLIGIVINQLSFDIVLRSSKSRYHYGYGYGYGEGYASEKRNK